MLPWTMLLIVVIIMPSLNQRMLLHCVGHVKIQSKSIQWIIFFYFSPFFPSHFSCLLFDTFLLPHFFRLLALPLCSLLLPLSLYSFHSSWSILLSFLLLSPVLLHLLLYSSTILKPFSFSLPPVLVHSRCHPAALFFYVHICLDVCGRPSYLPHADWATQHQLWSHEVLLRHRLGRACHYHR